MIDVRLRGMLEFPGFSFNCSFFVHLGFCLELTLKSEIYQREMPGFFIVCYALSKHKVRHAVEIEKHPLIDHLLEFFSQWPLMHGFLHNHCTHTEIIQGYLPQFYRVQTEAMKQGKEPLMKLTLVMS